MFTMTVVSTPNRCSNPRAIRAPPTPPDSNTTLRVMPRPRPAWGRRLPCWRSRSTMYDSWKPPTPSEPSQSERVPNRCRGRAAAGSRGSNECVRIHRCASVRAGGLVRSERRTAEGQRGGPPRSLGAFGARGHSVVGDQRRLRVDSRPGSVAPTGRLGIACRNCGPDRSVCRGIQAVQRCAQRGIGVGRGGDGRVRIPVHRHRAG